MKAFLINIDGAIFCDNTLLPSAQKLVASLQSKQVPHLFLTNSTARPRSAIVEAFSQAGLTIKAQEILTPVVACAQWLCEQNMERLSLLVPRETAADLVGFEILPLEGEELPQAILVGDLGDHWNYARLNHAFRFLKSETPPILVALGMNRFWHSEQGPRLGVAPFVKALEFASGCVAEVVGKPSVTFFEEAAHILDVPPSECVMVGDDIHNDIAGAQVAGMQAYLLKSGKFRQSDLDENIVPDAVFESLDELISML